MLNPQAKSELVCYLPQHIPSVWDTVKPLIQRAIDRGSDYTLSDIYDGLIQSKMQLWTSWSGDIEAALVTSIQDQHCLLLAVGGKNMAKWKVWLRLVEQWAKDEGAREMRIYGRRGWAKALGYDIDFTRLSKKL